MLIFLQVLLDDVKLSEQVMDLIFFLLSILAQWKKVLTSSTQISVQSCVLIPFKLSFDTSADNIIVLN
jgi:hypothetical protein